MTEWIPVTEKLPKEDGSYLALSLGITSYISGFDVNSKRFKVRNVEKDDYHLIQDSITHWAHLPEMPKKKRWRPKDGEKCYFLRSNERISYLNWQSNDEECEYFRTFLGIYKTEQEAMAIRDKIKAFVTSEIGEP